MAAKVKIEDLRIGQMIWIYIQARYQRCEIITLNREHHTLAYPVYVKVDGDKSPSIGVRVESVHTSPPPPKKLSWPKTNYLGYDPSKMKTLLGLLQKGHILKYEGVACEDLADTDICAATHVKVLIKPNHDRTDIMTDPATKDCYALSEKETMKRIMSAKDGGTWFLVYE